MRDRNKELSSRQAQVLACVEARIGVSTTGIALALDLHVGHAHSLCSRLRRRGLLRKPDKRGSNWSVTAFAVQLLNLKPRQCPRCKGKGFVA